jgi:hypothetical protein
MHDPLTQAVHVLLWVNVGLQLIDGLATYHGLQLGAQEMNLLLHASITHWDVGGALVGWKLLACGLLVFLRLVNRPVLAVKALIVTATAYVCFSLVPWLRLFFSHG